MFHDPQVWYYQVSGFPDDCELTIEIGVGEVNVYGCQDLRNAKPHKNHSTGIREPIHLGRSLLLKGAEKYEQAFDQFRHKTVVQLFHGIRELMIVGISVIGGIGDHDRLKPPIPERCVVAEPYRRQEPPCQWNAQLDYREFRVSLKGLK
jgi:hypothetical protein